MKKTTNYRGFTIAVEQHHSARFGRLYYSYVDNGEPLIEQKAYRKESDAIAKAKQTVDFWLAADRASKQRNTQEERAHVNKTKVYASSKTNAIKLVCREARIERDRILSVRHLSTRARRGPRCHKYEIRYL